MTSRTLSVRAFYFGRSVCLTCVRSRKLCKIRTKFCHLYKKSWLESKNMTSDFAPELDKYPKSSPKSPNSPKWGSRKRCEIRAKFRHPYRKAGSPNKNMMSDFAPELAKYPKRSHKPKIVQNSVWASVSLCYAMQLVQRIFRWRLIMFHCIYICS